MVRKSEVQESPLGTLILGQYGGQRLFSIAYCVRVYNKPSIMPWPLGLTAYCTTGAAVMGLSKHPWGLPTHKQAQKCTNYTHTHTHRKGKKRSRAKLGGFKGILGQYQTPTPHTTYPAYCWLTSWAQHTQTTTVAPCLLPFLNNPQATQIRVKGAATRQNTV